VGLVSPPRFLEKGWVYPLSLFGQAPIHPLDYVRKGKFSRDSIGNRDRVCAAGGGEGACLGQEEGYGGLYTPLGFWRGYLPHFILDVRNGIHLMDKSLI